MLERKVTMSGVVSPVVTDSSAVVTPRVPIDAETCPAMRQSWRVSSTLEVLPLVPVTATIVPGKGAKNLAARLAKARRGSSAAIRAAPSTGTSGRVTTATAPAPTASGMKSSPLNRVPRKAPNTVPGATLRWSIAKPVTRESDSPPARSRRRIGSMLFFAVDVGEHLGHVGVASGIGRHAQHGADSGDDARHHRRDVPRRSVESIGLGQALGVVEHGDHHITRLVHREHAGEGGNDGGTGIVPARELFGGAGLAADPIAGGVGLLSGAVGDDQPEKRAHA